MKQFNWRTVAALAGAALLVGTLAHATINKERGNIVSTDWNKMEMKIKDPKGRVGTWTVQRDATVTFTDKASDFPDPKVTDLRPPMYIYFMFEAGTSVISSIEVREVGYEPSKGGPGVQQKAIVTNLDINVGHVEVKLDTGVKTFKVDPKSQLNDGQAGREGHAPDRDPQRRGDRHRHQAAVGGHSGSEQLLRGEQSRARPGCWLASRRLPRSVEVP